MISREEAPVSGWTPQPDPGALCVVFLKPPRPDALSQGRDAGSVEIRDPRRRIFRISLINLRGPGVRR
jgi:hypothetical protein